MHIDHREAEAASLAAFGVDTYLGVRLRLTSFALSSRLDHAWAAAHKRVARLALMDTGFILAFMEFDFTICKDKNRRS